MSLWNVPLLSAVGVAVWLVAGLVSEKSRQAQGASLLRSTNGRACDGLADEGVCGADRRCEWTDGTCLLGRCPTVFMDNRAGCESNPACAWSAEHHTCWAALDYAAPPSPTVPPPLELAVPTPDFFCGGDHERAVDAAAEAAAAAVAEAAAAEEADAAPKKKSGKKQQQQQRKAEKKQQKRVKKAEKKKKKKEQQQQQKKVKKEKVEEDKASFAPVGAEALPAHRVRERRRAFRPMFRRQTTVFAHASLQKGEGGEAITTQTASFRYGGLGEGGRAPQAFSLTFNLPSEHVLARNESLYLTLSLRDAQNAYSHSVVSHNLVRYRPPSQRGFPPGYKNLLYSDKAVQTCEADAAAEEGAVCGEAVGAEVEVEGEEQDFYTEKAKAKGAWVPYLQTKVVFAAVPDMQDKLGPNDLPEFFAKTLRFDTEGGFYHPVVYEHDFWLQRQDFVPLNDSTRTVTVNVTVEGQSLIQFSAYQAMGLYESYGLLSKNDNYFRQLLRTDPFWLVMMVVASLAHSVFHVLAFKNDVTFWRKQRTVKGQSITTMALRTGMSTVIFLYLLDGEGTSRIILFNVGTSLAVEIWKLLKVLSIQRARAEEKAAAHAAGEAEEAEDEAAAASVDADRQAARYLFYTVCPLLVLYSGYSLVYHMHKSVYSFVLSTLVRFIYWFGFIMLTPQLFVNYRLKSVAFMPWRAFTYKAFGTFVDDLMSFALDMPTAHRLSCLRDDAIFLVYLYQYYAYSVDHSRVNEYGQCPLLAMSPDDLARREAALSAQLTAAHAAAESAADADVPAAGTDDATARALRELTTQLAAVVEARAILQEKEAAALLAAAPSSSSAASDASTTPATAADEAAAATEDAAAAQGGEEEEEEDCVVTEEEEEDEEEDVAAEEVEDDGDTLEDVFRSSTEARAESTRHTEVEDAGVDSSAVADARDALRATVDRVDGAAAVVPDAPAGAAAAAPADAGAPFSTEEEDEDGFVQVNYSANAE